MAELWDIPFGERHGAVHESAASRLSSGRMTPNFKPGRHLSRDDARLLAACAGTSTRSSRGLDEGRYDYEQLMSDLCIVARTSRSPSAFPRSGTSLEHYEPGQYAAPPLHGRADAAVEERREPARRRLGWRGSARRSRRGRSNIGSSCRRSVAAGRLKGIAPRRAATTPGRAMTAFVLLCAG